MAHLDIVKPFGVNQRCRCSRSVKALQTSVRGAANTRVRINGFPAGEVAGGGGVAMGIQFFLRRWVSFSAESARESVRRAEKFRPRPARRGSPGNSRGRRRGGRFEWRRRDTP